MTAEPAGLDLTDRTGPAPATEDHFIDLREGHAVDPVPVEIVPLGVTKRLVDVALASVGLILSSPIWLAIAVAIKLDDRGPVFYKQVRRGRGNTTFKLHKFRTMVPDSDARFGIRLATEDDDRITRVGKVLRKMGLDELPQFLNILLGHMSFVGPRALAVGEVVPGVDGAEIRYEDIPDFDRRLAVRPGLTGLATIYLPRDASPYKKLEYDVRYIEEWSFWSDIRLILTSFAISLRGRWETRDEKCAPIEQSDETVGSATSGTTR